VSKQCLRGETSPVPLKGAGVSVAHPLRGLTPRDEILARWEGRLTEWGALHALVDGKTIAEQVLADLRQLGDAYDMTPLSLTAAAAESGYSPGHLGREVKAGRIPNAGRENAPRILRRDLPRKPGNLRVVPAENMLERKRIARAVANSNGSER
jgi:hypothetical protein